MSETNYKNEFYTHEDFLEILSDMRKQRDDYKKNKHTMDLLEVIQARENLAIANSELGDIGADLFFDKQRTDAEYRTKLLTRQEEIEEEMITQEINPKTNKKWTNILDRARYKAELECREERQAADEAKKIHARAYHLYAKTIPDILAAMAGRINFLIRLMPLGQPTEQEAAEATKSLPAARKWRDEDDNFNTWNTDRNVGRTMDELENELEEELKEQEPEII